MKDVSRFDLSGFFFRVLPAVSGAFLGSLFALGFFFALQIASGGSADNPELFSRFILFALVFISALSGNILAAILSPLAEGEDFSGKWRPLLFHIFGSILVLLGILAPLFLWLSLEHSLQISQVFLPFSALVTALFWRAFSDPEFPLLLVYEALVSGFLLIVVWGFVFSRILPPEMAPFFALPVSWLLLSVSSFVVGKIFFLLEAKKSLVFPHDS